MKVSTLVRCGLFSALIAVTAWISVPFAVPFTMQTFGVFCALLILGGKFGTISIAVYVLIGTAGFPVFAGFHGGIGIILSPLGGFLLGFIAMGAAFLLITGQFGNKLSIQVAALIAGLLLCYIIGTTWYAFISGTDLLTAFTACAVPFIIPDAIKLWLAVAVSKRTKKVICIQT